MRASAPAPRGSPELTALAFKVRGMDCAEEVAILKRAVGPLVGGAERLGFDVLAGRMTVPPGTRMARASSPRSRPPG